ncbi:hypothetical protein R1sor_005705 [Riccia sorocarpa]|uniref:Uncharacterized protein n=1 Tax=Riccia sorocarpa TaxID=122646 RepID=A0ABD3HP14_9MARC
MEGDLARSVDGGRIEDQLEEEHEAQDNDLALLLRSPEKWADIQEEEMSEHASRGIKGRPMDADGTPDKGNSSKRRPPQHQKVDSFSQLIPTRLKWNTEHDMKNPKPPDKGRADTDPHGSQERSRSHRSGSIQPEPGDKLPESEQVPQENAPLEEVTKQNFSSYNHPKQNFSSYSLPEIYRRLAQARIQIQEDMSEANHQQFEEALLAARRREQLDIRTYRIRCRIKWLRDGDASSKFFFACLKAKTQREEITSIKLDSGEIVTEESRILKLIEETYGELYTAEEESSEIRSQRREILQLVDKRLTQNQNRKLEEAHSEELIEEIVKSLPQEKSLGFDGVTAEVLVAGVTTSNPVDENLIVKAIVQKLMKRLAHWSNRFLSWPEKIVLLKQVLADTPLYQLLSVGMEQKGLEGVEALCRQFLWGWVDQEHAKSSMVAWERITQVKQDGGLGWTPLTVKARALHVKNLMKVMLGSTAEWAMLARTLRTGWYQRERRQWSVPEVFLLLHLTKIQGSRTLTRMWGGWNKQFTTARKHGFGDFYSAVILRGVEVRAGPKNKENVSAAGSRRRHWSTFFGNAPRKERPQVSEAQESSTSTDNSTATLLEIDVFPQPKISDRQLEITRLARSRVQGWSVTWLSRRTQGGTQTGADYLTPLSQTSIDERRVASPGPSTTTGDSTDEGPTQSSVNTSHSESVGG